MPSILANVRRLLNFSCLFEHVDERMLEAAEDKVRMTRPIDWQHRRVSAQSHDFVEAEATLVPALLHSKFRELLGWSSHYLAFREVMASSICSAPFAKSSAVQMQRQTNQPSIVSMTFL